MKSPLLTLLSLLQSTMSFGASVSVIAPCEELPSLVYEKEETDSLNIGTLTVLAFNELEIDYIGNAHGMNSILNSPTGMDAMEIISDKEMFAYGWCFSVNGQSPAVYADEVQAQDSDEVLWWYGFAHYNSGKWLSMCTPSYLRQDSLFCQGILQND